MQLMSDYFLISIVSIILAVQCSPANKRSQVHPDLQPTEGVLHNRQIDGYRGIWYMNQPLQNEYKFKYSGGLATYCAKHNPFAIYQDAVKKTFFCYGGTDSRNSTLYHMVSFYDHTTRKVSKPTLVLDKRTIDAHDNPVMSIDDHGYIYLFSTSHGTARPSYIHKSKKPYDITAFEPVNATKVEDGKEVPITNFSYMQSWYVPGNGFVNFFTRYNYPAARTICFMTSPDGENWSEWKRIASIKKGHYQISAATGETMGSAFNFHPDTEEKNGLNWRTNLYYVQSRDFGKTWHSADGSSIELPLTEIQNPALVYDYYQEDLNVYMKDITYDHEDRPVILYITSKGFEAGPKNDPRIWRTAHWKDDQWHIRDVTTSNSNYDMGSLFIEEDGTWRIIAPTEDGPQPFNPGGEMVMWESQDEGRSWQNAKQLTHNSEYNHTYARRPINAHPDFYAFWADGHGRQPSKSRLYFSTKSGVVFRLPEQMKEDHMFPERLQ